MKALAALAAGLMALSAAARAQSPDSGLLKDTLNIAAAAAKGEPTGKKDAPAPTPEQLRQNAADAANVIALNPENLKDNVAFLESALDALSRSAPSTQSSVTNIKTGLDGLQSRLDKKDKKCPTGNEQERLKCMTTGLSKAIHDLRLSPQTGSAAEDPPVVEVAAPPLDGSLQPRSPAYAEALGMLKEIDAGKSDRLPSADKSDRLPVGVTAAAKDALLKQRNDLVQQAAKGPAHTYDVPAYMSQVTAGLRKLEEQSPSSKAQIDAIIKSLWAGDGVKLGLSGYLWAGTDASTGAGDSTKDLKDPDQSACVRGNPVGSPARLSCLTGVLRGRIAALSLSPQSGSSATPQPQVVSAPDGAIPALDPALYAKGVGLLKKAYAFTDGDASTMLALWQRSLGARRFGQGALSADEMGDVVRSFQAAHHLDPSGILDGNTRLALDAYRQTIESSKAPQRGEQSARVAVWQQFLHTFVDPHEVVDGMWGNQTDAVWRGWLATRGLTCTSATCGATADPQLLKTLSSIPAAQIPFRMQRYGAVGDVPPPADPGRPDSGDAGGVPSQVKDVKAGIVAGASAAGDTLRRMASLPVVPDGVPVKALNMMAAYLDRWGDRFKNQRYVSIVDTKAGLFHLIDMQKASVQTFATNHVRPVSGRYFGYGNVPDRYELSLGFSQTAGYHDSPKLGKVLGEHGLTDSIPGTKVGNTTMFADGKWDHIGGKVSHGCTHLFSAAAFNYVTSKIKGGSAVLRYDASVMTDDIMKYMGFHRDGLGPRPEPRVAPQPQVGGGSQGPSGPAYGQAQAAAPGGSTPSEFDGGRAGPQRSRRRSFIGPTRSGTFQARYSGYGGGSGTPGGSADSGSGSGEPAPPGPQEGGSLPSSAQAGGQGQYSGKPVIIGHTREDHEGGDVDVFAAKYEKIRQSGRKVEIDGPCVSACTIVAHLPHDQVCVTRRAELGVHLAADDEGDDAAYTRWAVKKYYPQALQDWIKTHGGLGHTPKFVKGQDLLKIFDACPNR